MKARLFRSSKGGWYLFGRNYNDKEDKAYCNVHFANNYAVEPQTTGDYIDVNIEEASCSSYKGKFGLTIFKYSILDTQKEEEHEEAINEYADKFGGETKVNNVVITQDELPFY